MKFLSIVAVAMLLFAMGCSDSGDSPTGGDGGPITLSVADVQVNEGNNATVTVRLSGVAYSDVIFSYTTTNGSATSGDYTAVVGIDTIFAGSTTTNILITINDDGDIEGTESFTFVISSPVNATIADASATVTIIDNDGVSYVADVRPIITNNGCLGSSCHGGAAGGLNMGSATYAQVRNGSGDHGAIIAPGNAANSNLYLKLTATPPFGSRMPLGFPALSTTEINKIRDWIDQGALDN